MKLNFTKQMPSDEVVLCDSSNDCIEARGENAKLLVGAVVFTLACIGLSYLFKSLK